MRLQEFKDSESGTVYHLCPDGEPSISLARIKQDGNMWVINYAWYGEETVPATGNMTVDKAAKMAEQTVWDRMNIQNPFASIHGSWS